MFFCYFSALDMAPTWADPGLFALTATINIKQKPYQAKVFFEQSALTHGKIEQLVVSVLHLYNVIVSSTCLNLITRS